MNKWMYLVSSCVFLLLVIMSYPVVKDSLSGTNLYLMLMFVMAFGVSLFMFIKKSFTSLPENNSLNEFTPVD